MTKKKTGIAGGLNLKTTTALVIIIFLLGIGSTLLFYSLYKVAYVQFYDITVRSEDSNIAGFNADPDLDFGSLPMRGGAAIKRLNVHNDWDIPLLLVIKLSGEASQFISVEKNSFVLEPDESTTISVSARIPKDFNQTGTFKGNAKIVYYRI